MLFKATRTSLNQNVNQKFNFILTILFGKKQTNKILKCLQDTTYYLGTAMYTGYYILPGDCDVYMILDINLGTSMFTGYWILIWELQCLQDTGY